MAHHGRGLRQPLARLLLPTLIEDGLALADCLRRFTYALDCLYIYTHSYDPYRYIIYIYMILDIDRLICLHLSFHFIRFIVKEYLVQS